LLLFPFLENNNYGEPFFKCTAVYQRQIEVLWRAEEEERHKGSLTLPPPKKKISSKKFGRLPRVLTS
jgi:hypothetical protein